MHQPHMTTNNNVAPVSAGTTEEKQMDNMGYVSLHNHTAFSILDSLIKPIQLFKKAKELGQTAVAVTDHGTLAGMWDSLKASRETGVKLIAGCEFYFVDDVKEEDARFRHVILLAKNEVGYRNLLRASAEGYDNFVVSFKRAIPRIDWKILEKYSEGVICLTACSNGILGQLINEKRYDEAEGQAQRLKTIFGDNLGLELQPHYLKRSGNDYSSQIDQALTNRKIREIAERNDIRCVVTTDAHYVVQDQHDSHNVLLAVAAGAPVNSGSRLQYNVPDFYIKSGEEVYNKLKRQFILDDDKGDAFARQCIANSKYFADLCEEAEWVDPKYSNPSGKELPAFPVKEQEDYAEFLEWCSSYESWNSELKNKGEDEKYLRFRCHVGLISKIPEEKHEEYQARLEEEFDVMEYHKFSSYMLIVMDYIDWAKKNDIPVGPGRGCLTGDTEVLTDNGFVRLDSIDVGDVVFTHTGKKQLVYDKFVYPVNETGIEIGTDYSFSNIKLTKDHKVYASIAKETDRYVSMKSSGLLSYNRVKRWEDPEDPKWIPADELKVGDCIFMPFPKRLHFYSWNGNDYLDLSQFTQDPSLIVIGDKIGQKIPKTNSLSIRNIAKETGLSRGAVQHAKYGKMHVAFTEEKISKYLDSIGSTFEEWKSDNNEYVKMVNRKLCKDNELLYVLGRWVGDGWSENHPEKGYCIGFAFHSEDNDGINRIFAYFDSKGFNVKRYNSTNKKSTQLVIKGRLLYDFFISMFDGYKQSSKTKHLPDVFRTISDENLRSLLLGLSDSDGHVEISKDYKRESIDTTSKRLALEVKEALLYLGIPSSINTRPEYFRGKYLCSESYKVRFKGLKLEKSTSSLVTDAGYFCKITSLSEVDLDTVYDISVEDDTSYLTSNYAVHNSVGGSLIGYLADIHMVDPIKYGLIFARFHNKQKTSFPDIDTDFAPSGRAKVQDYIRRKYGDEHVAHVSNVNTMTPKVYARAIARSFVYGGDRKTAVGVGTAIADAIPNEMKSVTQALEKAALFSEYAKEYPELRKYAEDLGGKSVAWSTHAGGVVIGKRSLRDIVPIRRDKDGNVAIEYEKNRAEDNGLVKMDTLGLETLDIIDETYKLIAMAGKPLPPRYPNFDEYDKKTYDLISRGDTFCVFQLGTSGGTIDLCKRVKPHCIEDLAVINSLARPSARDIRSAYIDVRDGKKPVEIIHPSLERAFKPTLGFGLYEECLMYLAQDVAGWSLHSADRLRKLTKEKGKNPEKARKWKEEFINDSVKNGIPQKTATSIWDDVVDKFQGYGFNKSHAIFYSLIGYHTAWLKAHYPLEFLVANLRSEVNSNAKVAKDNIAKIKEEIRRLGVKIIPPDVNTSDTTYKIVDEGTLMTGFDSLKYMGKDAIPELIEKRPFENFEDLMVKVDGRKVKAPAIQALAASGCLSSFDMPRKLMFLYAADYRAKLNAFMKRKKQEDSFNYPWPNEEEWTIPERCALERFYLGESLSGDKVQEYNGFFTYGAIDFGNLSKLHPPPPDTMNARAQRNYKTRVTALQGEVKNLFEFKVKKEGSKIQGEVMAKITLEDPHGNHVTMTCFPDGWTKLQDRCRQLSGNKEKMDIGVGLYINGSLNWYEGDISVIFEDLAKFSPPPQLPTDLKAKKISMRRTSRKKKTDEDSDRNILLDEIEEELAESGNADLDEWDNDLS